MTTFGKFTLSLISILILFSCKPSQQSENNENSAAERYKKSVPLVSNGKIDRIENFHSELISPRHVDVWLPKNYDGKQKFSVLYMHDGQMLFDSSQTWNKQEWGVDEVLTDLMDKQHIANTIVVGIHNSQNRHKDYFPDVPQELLSPKLQDSLQAYFERVNAPNFLDSLNSFAYVQFIANELKPYIDQHYKVSSKRRDTYLAGSSMGGLISMYALCEFPDVFGGAICMSTHWPGMFDNIDNPIPSYFLAYMKENLPEGGTHRFYFDYGTETLDTMYAPYQKKVDALMIEKGYPDKFWFTEKYEGHDHSERSWRKRLHYPMTFMLSGI